MRIPRQGGPSTQTPLPTSWATKNKRRLDTQLPLPCSFTEPSLSRAIHALDGSQLLREGAVIIYSDSSGSHMASLDTGRGWPDATVWNALCEARSCTFLSPFKCELTPTTPKKQNCHSENLLSHLTQRCMVWVALSSTQLEHHDFHTMEPVRHLSQRERSLVSKTLCTERSLTEAA